MPADGGASSGGNGSAGEPQSGGDVGAAASRWASDGLPALDDATVAHVRALHAKGAARGNRDDIFMKIGDSITSSPSFLYDIGLGNYQLGKFGDLRAPITAFSKTMFDDNTNCFTRYNDAVQSGLTTRDVVPNMKWVTAEIDAIHPAWAIMLFGTDDLDIMEVDEFTANYQKILDVFEQRGVVVTITTLPYRAEYQRAIDLVPVFNDAIHKIAATRHLPIVELMKALDPLPNRGIGDDNVHPTVELAADGGTMSGDFTDHGLTFGYNVRNLTTVQMFDRLREVVK